MYSSLYTETSNTEIEADYSNGVFRGSSGLSNFLRPDSPRPTPIVELPPHLNPYLDKNVHVFAKMLNMTPLMNIKSIPAFHMIDQAYNEGKLEGVDEIVESSSGNTALSLSVFARQYGVESAKVIVDDTLSICLLKNLLLFGLKVQVHPTTKESTDSVRKSRVNLAREEGQKPGKCNLDQYENKDNPLGHYKYTANEILSQLSGDIQVFSTGLGTTGTMVGVSQALRVKNSNVKCVGTVRSPNTYVPGPRTLDLLSEVSYPWQDCINSLQEATPEESYTMSLKLLRSGIMGGPSSGLSLVGTFKYLDQCIEDGTLDSLRNSKGEINVVFLVCDSPFLHVDKYFKHVSKEQFLSVENGHLLKESCSGVPTIECSTCITPMPILRQKSVDIEPYQAL